MTYKTHVAFGKNAFWLGLPFAFSSGILLNPLKVYSDTGSIVVAGVTSLVTYISLTWGYKASLFGAEFPDLDMEGTTPSKNHKWLGKFIRSFGVRHRGRYSHSFDAQTLTFLLLGLLLCFVLPNALYKFGFDSISAKFGKEDAEILLAQFMVGGIIYQLIFSTLYFTILGTWSHLLADLPTGGGVRVVFWQHKPFLLKHKFFRTGEDEIWEQFLRKVATTLIPLSILFSFFIVVFDVNIFVVFIEFIQKIVTLIQSYTN